MGKITPHNWGIILKKMPELVGFADTKAMSGDEIVEIFSKHKGIEFEVSWEHLTSRNVMHPVCQGLHYG